MGSHHIPPAQWLRTFLHVTHSGSFSEAAERLNMTQTAVSKHIRQLEHSYGVSLFKRHARGVELSEAGKALYPKVEQAFELLGQAGDALHHDTQRKRVRLRCDATWAEAVLAPKLADFCRRHDDIQLVLNSYIWADESNRSDSDLYIAYSDGEQAGFEGQRLSTEYSFVVCSPELKAQLDCSDQSTRDQVPKLMLTDHEALWTRWEQNSDRAYNGPRLTSDSSIVCKRAALAGQGLSMQRHSLVRHELTVGSLIKLDDIELDYSETYYLYKQAGRVLNSAEQRVWDWIVEHRQ